MQSAEGAPDVRRFIVSQDDGSYLIEHGDGCWVYRQYFGFRIANFGFTGVKPLLFLFEATR